MRSSRAVISAFLAVLLCAPGAAAQAPSDEARARARVIGEEGLAFFDQGMYIDALDRFEKADALLHAPTLGLMAARSLERLGRYVEASERYLQVTRMEIDAKASDVWKQSVVSAAKDRDALLPKIPSIEITVDGPGAGSANVRIDGRQVPKAVIGIKTPIDPGVHRIEARGPGNVAAVERITLREGEAARITLTLKPMEKGAIADAAPGSSGDAPPPSNVGSGVAAAAVTAATPAGPGPDSPAAMGLGGQPGALDDQTRATARAIGEEGLTLYDQGKYVDALDRFERADDLIKAPTLGLMAARSLDKLGRLVEASDRYQQVASMKVEANASEAFKQAQSAATKEREALVPRIPNVDVSVAGPGANEVETVILDGRRVSPSLLGSARPISGRVPVDPGDHRVEAKSSGGEAYERFSISEGGTERVVLTLGPSPNKLLAPPGKKGEEKGAPGDASSQAPPERKGKTQETLGWVSIGVGAAGVVLGAITGGVAAGIRGDFTDPPCDDTTRTCPATLQDDIDTYNALRPVSSVGFIVGGIGLAAGTVLLVTLPRGGARYSTSGVKMSPFIGPMSAGIRGTF